MSEFSVDNLLRIADEKERRLGDIRANWKSIIKHMDSAERQKYSQQCRDERTTIFILRKMAEILEKRRRSDA